MIINSKYTDILTPLGDVQQAVDEAVRRYAVEKVGERIAELHHMIRNFEDKYNSTYESFFAHIATDEDFVAGLREVNSTWERDFHEWEFYVEELREWLNRLEQFSMR